MNKETPEINTTYYMAVPVPTNTLNPSVLMMGLRMGRMIAGTRCARINPPDNEESDILYELLETTVFDGASTYIDTGVKLFDTQKDFTILFDITAPETQNNEATLVTSSEAGTGETLLIRDQGGYMAVSSVGARNPTDEESDGSWGHRFYRIKTVALVFAAGVFQFGKYYKNTDGTIRGITAHANNVYIQNNGTLRIGANRKWDDAPTNFWTGILHDFRVYNRAMTEDEVLALINTVNA